MGCVLSSSMGDIDELRQLKEVISKLDISNLNDDQNISLNRLYIFLDRIDGTLNSLRNNKFMSLMEIEEAGRYINYFTMDDYYNVIGIIRESKIDSILE